MGCFNSSMTTQIKLIIGKQKLLSNLIKSCTRSRNRQSNLYEHFTFGQTKSGLIRQVTS